MSKDIRSFFKSQKPKTKEAVKVILSDDDDVIPESPNVQIQKKKKESRKKRVLDDSSDEEIFTKKKKPSIESKKKPEKQTLKEVKASDMFGGPIKRTEPIVEKGKPKTEIGIHDDDDFEKSLLEIDAIEQESFNKVKDEKVDKQQVTPKEDKAQETEAQKSNGDLEKITPKKLEKYKIPKKSPEKIKSEDRHPPISRNESAKEESHSKHNKDYKTDSKSESRKHRDSERSHDRSNDRSREHKHKERSHNHDEKEKPISNKIPTKNGNSDKSVSPKMDKKRDFSEFINDSTSTEENVDTEESKYKKKKLDQSLNASVVSDEERHERKRHSAMLYQNYLNRSGPKNLGAKQIPEGAPDCLKDLAFLLTGVLDSFERDEIAAAVTKYGGCVKSGISRKVTHVLAGEDAGPAKLAKAEELGIKIINEDEFLQMIANPTKTDKNCNLPGTTKKVDSKKDSQTKSEESKKSTNEKKLNKSDEKKSSKTKVSEDKMKSFEEKVKKSFYGKTETAKVDSSPEKESEKVTLPEKSKSEGSKSSVASIPNNSQLWVDKYRPQNIKQIIGQHGDQSVAKKLMNWLSNWYASRKAKQTKPSPWSKNNDGAYYKAALVSGPPGIGKTTTVSLVCKELGFDVVEFNASDTRNKTLIKQQISELLTTNSLSRYAMGDTGRQAVSKKRVLVMDEVDGMAGNEDRGGLQELIALIKISSIPIVCMCNDRNSDKMRTLVNYCFDLKMPKPRQDQIKSAMLSVCFKEHIKVPPDALTQLIVSCNLDIRQTLNSLSVWAACPDKLDTDNLKQSANATKKDLKLGPWEVIRNVFSEEFLKTASMSDKIDLFFYDYNIAPLFVHENYLGVTPHCDKKEMLNRVSEAADSLSLGDIAETTIRRTQAWSLLPHQAVLSSVVPGAAMCGHISSQIQFPGWLGKNSRANKMQRLAQELHAHTRLTTTGSKSSIFLDYAKYLRDAILSPLRKGVEGVEVAVGVMADYRLTREDLDALGELAQWPGERDPMTLVEPKVKAAMTRAYNKQCQALPYAAPSVSKKKHRADGDDNIGDDDGGDGDESERDSEPENDAMIKVKKKQAPKSQEPAKPSSSKGEKSKRGKKK